VVELPPALAPVVVDVGRLAAGERVQEAPLPVCIGVDGELETVGPLGLLEALGEELQDERARLLGPLERDDDGDAS
jgi:hypothetical protein